MQVHRALPVLIAVLAATLASSSDARPSASHPYVIRGNVVGGFDTRGGYAEARDRFGWPFSSTTTNTTCTFRWPDGLVLVFARRQPLVKLERACIELRSATIKGREWRTDRGLRVGQPVTTLRRLYPNAARTPVGASVRWRLLPGSTPALDAWTRNGRVTQLRLARSGG